MSGDVFSVWGAVITTGRFLVCLAIVEKNIGKPWACQALLCKQLFA